KYILKQNTDKISGDKLTFDEKKDILKNINGYDIEPSMVRIAEMNLFLHGATEPKIFEYDTLTMDDRWNDKYDCILANPPFMTPKGGIKPHSKFSVKASKSEILFVDYISNHLTINGKAGIIIPDGVVFKQDKAFKDVRKDIIEKNLYAVISLPNGIFQPYAGVSTNILLLDKNFSKKVDNILFVELTNDGLSLTTQRKPISGNQIPEIIEVVKYYKSSFKVDNDYSFLVSKADIINNNYDLSFNKYKKYDNYVDESLNYNSEEIINSLMKFEKEYEKLLFKLGEL
ncbi:MAG: N-6 DNA methylase, partial [Bacilli bacterium]